MRAAAARPPALATLVAQLREQALERRQNAGSRLRRARRPDGLLLLQPPPPEGSALRVVVRDPREEPRGLARLALAVELGGAATEQVQDRGEQPLRLGDAPEGAVLQPIEGLFRLAAEQHAPRFGEAQAATEKGGQLRRHERGSPAHALLSTRDF